MNEFFLMPEVQLSLWGIFLLVVESCRRNVTVREVAHMGMLGVGLVFAATWLLPQGDGQVLWAQNLYVLDSTAVFFKRFFLVAVFLVLWMASESAEELPLARNEFVILPLFPTVGMMLLASAADLTTFFVALELVTISFYVLVAYQRDRLAALEAGTKYLIIGALSTGFLVYGLAFLIGTVGSTSLWALENYLQEPISGWGIYLAIGLILAGLGFKAAAVPFHVWAPDVYQGAPTPVSAFLAVASKAAGIVALLRLFFLNGFSDDQIYLITAAILGVMGVASVLLGSLAALMQRNLKRLLGYSSIANAGFILLGLSCISYRGVEAVALYLCVYLLATILAFFIINRVGHECGGEDLSLLSGLSQRSPLAAAALLLAFVSLAGIPPLVGFWGKLGILSALWERAGTELPGWPHTYWILFGVAIFGAVAGLYYYLAPVRAMFWNDPIKEMPLIRFSSSSRILMSLLMAAIMLLGFWPQPLVKVAGSMLKSTAAVQTD